MKKEPENIQEWLALCIADATEMIHALNAGLEVDCQTMIELVGNLKTSSAGLLKSLTSPPPKVKKIKVPVGYLYVSQD